MYKHTASLTGGEARREEDASPRTARCGLVQYQARVVSTDDRLLGTARVSPIDDVHRLTKWSVASTSNRPINNVLSTHAGYCTPDAFFFYNCTARNYGYRVWNTAESRGAPRLMHARTAKTLRITYRVEQNHKLLHSALQRQTTLYVIYTLLRAKVCDKQAWLD